MKYLIVKSKFKCGRHDKRGIEAGCQSAKTLTTCKGAAELTINSQKVVQREDGV